MRSIREILKAAPILILLLLSTNVFADETDDVIPEVTDRVARISYIEGGVQIRRAESEDWEQAVLNLPITEGDEITTDGSARLEIQFNGYTHLRLAPNGFLKIVRLAEDGIAVSLPQGRMTLRAREFDPDAAYFEIDAPKTTIAIQKAGYFSIDAGAAGASDIRLAATEGGQATVYTYNANFVLRDGRSARVFVEGQFAGEFQASDAGAFSDDFDSWSLERDEMIARRLKHAHYDEYYDRDLYGAEELNEHGEWIHTRQYGYVWRPYASAVSSYSDWSPYRYGHWRWVPAFGWTWVNDEPWGWATYHHGRWFWDNGYWYWSPYGYYRTGRSWWRPALVVINIIGGNVCWYPLPYGYGYYNYNAHYYRRRRGHHNYYPSNPGGGAAPNPTPAPTPQVGHLPMPGPGIRTVKTAVPPGGVVTVPQGDFGVTKIRAQKAPAAFATKVLAAQAENTSPPLLPVYSDVESKVDQQIRVPRASVRPRPQTATGAAERKTQSPLDHELKKVRMPATRPPLEINTGRGEVKPPPADPVRNTGVFDRTERKPVVTRPAEPVRPAPSYEEPSKPVRTQEPVRSPEPVRPVERKPDPIRVQPPPRYEPPPRSEPSKPQRQEPVRQPPPPRNDPPKKSDPPPQKSEPSKPAAPAQTKKGK